MIKNPIDFENQFIEKFGDIDRITLRSLTKNKLRFELGGDETDLNRVSQAKDRSSQILQYCFNGLPIWLRIILWDKEGEMDLSNAGLAIETSDKNFRDENEEDILYLYLKKYSPLIVSPIVTSIINYEMAEEPSANITCYFVDFDRSIIMNIYDDRGMDVYSPNKAIIEGLLNRFSSWAINDV
ncbi:DUF3885 domain-containing protein [Pedobacter hiemivivus]|uniref:DUF3885 domain-containing protein n=1 Tax=Pedobacter hiemivivus TaxID=2530454 RepID=A0A4R0NF69_9SPHI|nr:DUF3885 domain-containing protein [Pedobacter hiemivivus]TCC97852.1 DUF3885 domain-containing protein [Pedobacter hiemivivus]